MLKDHAPWKAAANHLMFVISHLGFAASFLFHSALRIVKSYVALSACYTRKGCCDHMLGFSLSLAT